MKKLLVKNYKKISANKKKLEKELNVKITNRKGEISIDGAPVDEYEAEKVLDALAYGFPMKIALSIKEEDLEFEVLNIKDYTKRKDLERIRGRLIGKNGGALRTLTELTECRFEVSENSIGIIGEPENLQNAQHAIISIIQGAKHANVYAFLEKHRPKPVADLGLK